MIARNTTVASMQRALRAVNELFSGNVKFAKGPTPEDDGLLFTLAVHDSHRPGARVGIKLSKNGKPWHLAFACWHVHGHFFDALFAESPGAVLTSKLARITAESGNWQDVTIAGTGARTKYSDLCECGPELRKRGAVLIGKRRTASKTPAKKARGSLLSD